MRAPGAKEELAELKVTWDRIMSSAPKTPKRQPSTRGGPMKIFRHMIFPDPSMSEVFACADVVNPVLMRKALVWSRLAETVPHSGHDGSMATFHTVPVKGTKRALDKIYHSYDQDPGKICDACRCSLVFDTIKGLTGCLEILSRDEEIVICWVKNSKNRFCGKGNKSSGCKWAK